MVRRIVLMGLWSPFATRDEKRRRHSGRRADVFPALAQPEWLLYPAGGKGVWSAGGQDYRSRLARRETSAQGVATGFSGGIDSFAAIIQHFVRETSPAFRVSHLFFHNVGAHGNNVGSRGRRTQTLRTLFRQRLERVRPFARSSGSPLSCVDSNISEVVPIDFLRMHHALNAAVPLVLQNQFQRYFYASTYRHADCGVASCDDIARLDPFAFHLFSTETLDCVSSGCHLSRVEKPDSSPPTSLPTAI